MRPVRGWAQVSGFAYEVPLGEVLSAATALDDRDPDVRYVERMFRLRLRL